MERAVEAYVSREIPNIFSGYSLVAVNEALPGRIIADFHFRKQDGSDVFVEVFAREIGRTKLSQIINMYAAISNVEPPLRKFELIVIGPDVTASVRKELEKLTVRLLTYEQIGITSQKLLEVQEQEWLRRQEMSQLSPNEAKLVAKWESEKKVVVRASDVQEALDCTLNYAYFLLHNLERKHWIERVARGLYQFIPLSYGYPERIPPSNAEPEKSLVDSFDKPKYAGGIEQLARIAWRGLPRVNEEKLVKYAVRMDSHALIQRLGFIIHFLAEEELVKPLPLDLKNLLLKHVGKTAIYLDPRRPKKGEYSREWRMINNVPRSQLLSEIEIR